MRLVTLEKSDSRDGGVRVKKASGTKKIKPNGWSEALAPWRFLQLTLITSLRCLFDHLLNLWLYL